MGASELFSKCSKLKIMADKFFTLFCVVTFLYQSISLFKSFMQGKTVVNIEIGQYFDDKLPAITICPGALALDKLAQLNESYKTLISQYQEYVKTSNDTRFTERFYFNILFKVLDDLENGFPGFDIYDIMKNYSYSYLDDNNQTNINIEVLKSLNVRMSGQRAIVHYNGTNKPVESITPDFHLRKCFTFYSALQPQWKSIKTRFYHIAIIVKLIKNMYPYELFAYPLIMHDQKELPPLDHGKSHQVKANYIYLLKYSQIRMLRLGEGYDTNCRDYGKDKLIRSDCISDCYQRHHNRICNASGIPFSTMLQREEIIRKNRKGHVSFCEQYENSQLNIISICSKVCPNECDFTYYSTTLNNVRPVDGSNNIIFIQHNEMPDILIVHIPDIGFISFVCNFGGLLGMWLGVSFLSIIDLIKSLFVKLIKEKGRPINIQLKQFNYHIHKQNKSNGIFSRVSNVKNLKMGHNY